jgi:hypothetical protein
LHHVVAHHAGDARCSACQPGDDADECRFPSAIWAEKPEELALLDHETDTVQRVKTAKAFEYAVELYGSGHGHELRLCAAPRRSRYDAPSKSDTP